LWPYFMPPPLLGFPPSEFSPHKRSRFPLEIASSLVVIHRHAERAARFLSPAVSPTSPSSCGCLVPQLTMNSLFTHFRTLPGCSGLRSADSFSSASFTYFEALFPPASPFATGYGLPHRLVATLLGFAPLKLFLPRLGFSTYLVLGPRCQLGWRH
jgi:hypothetical protein